LSKDISYSCSEQIRLPDYQFQNSRETFDGEVSQRRRPSTSSTTVVLSLGLSNHMPIYQHVLRMSERALRLST